MKRRARTAGTNLELVLLELPLDAPVAEVVLDAPLVGKVDAATIKSELETTAKEVGVGTATALAYCFVDTVGVPVELIIRSTEIL
jgi:hypothetical protein